MESMPSTAHSPAEPDRHGPGLLEFGSFRIDLDTHEVWRNGRRLSVPPKPAHALALLVRRAGHLVRRDEFHAEIWDSRHLELDAGLNTLIRQLRHCLGDEAGAPRYIETVPRRGYRFIAPVRRVGTVGSRRHPRRLALVGLVLVVTVGSWLGLQGRPSSAENDLPGEFRRLAQAGRLLLDRETGEDAARALPLLEQILSAYPRHAPTLASHAMALVRVGRVPEARSAVASALSSDPALGEAWEVHGTLLLRDWQLGAARKAFERGVALDPTNARLHHSLAYAYALEGRQEQSRRAIETARRLEPLTPAIYGDAGLFELWAGRPSEALRQCTFASRLVEESFRIRVIRCLFRAHVALGNVEAARIHARDILREAGVSPDSISRVLADGLGGYWEWAANPDHVHWSQGSAGPYSVALVRADAGDVEGTLLALKDAFRQRVPALLQAAVEPRLRLLDGHPAFLSLLADIRAADSTSADPV